MSVTAGLAATKAALDITKLVMDKLNTASIDVHQVRGGVQELLIHAVNAQVALGEAQVEISELRQEIAKRDALESVGEDLQYQTDGGFYIRKSDGAFCCPACWGDKRKAVPMTPMASGYYTCPIHNASYPTKGARDKKQADENVFAVFPMVIR